MLMWKQLEVNPWIWRRWCLCITDSGVCWDCTDSDVIWNLFKETLRRMVLEKLLIKSMIEKVKSTSKVSFLIISQTGLDRENAVWWFLAYTRSKTRHRLNSFTVKCLYAWTFLTTKATSTIQVVNGGAIHWPLAVQSLEEDFTSRPGFLHVL